MLNSKLHKYVANNKKILNNSSKACFTPKVTTIIPSHTSICLAFAVWHYTDGLVICMLFWDRRLHTAICFVVHSISFRFLFCIRTYVNKYKCTTILHSSLVVCLFVCFRDIPWDARAGINPGFCSSKGKVTSIQMPHLQNGRNFSPNVHLIRG